METEKISQNPKDHLPKWIPIAKRLIEEAEAKMEEKEVKNAN